MTTIQFRRGTDRQWLRADPVLAAGEPGYETNTGRFKIGNGNDRWSALPYYASDTDVRALGGVPSLAVSRAELDGATSVSQLLNERMELAARFGVRSVLLPVGTWTVDFTGLRADDGLGDLIGPADSGGRGWSLRVPYGVWLRGAGRDLTVLRLDPSSRAGTTAADPGRYTMCKVGAARAGGSDVRISDLTLDAEQFARSSSAAVPVVHAAFEGGGVTETIGGVILEDARIVGGSTGFGCAKDGNAIAASQRTTEQFTGWWCRRVQFERQTSSCVDYAEAKHSGGEDLTLVAVARGPRVALSSRFCTWTRVRGTAADCGFEVGDGVTDVVVTDPRVTVAGPSGLPSGTGRGALLLRCEPVLRSSEISRVTVRGGYLGDTTPALSRVVAFETTPQSNGHRISGVRLHDVILDGDVWITEIVNPAQTVIADVNLDTCQVTGALRSSSSHHVRVSGVELRFNTFTATDPTMINGRAWQSEANRYRSGLVLDTVSQECDSYRDLVPDAMVTDRGTGNTVSGTRPLDS